MTRTGPTRIIRIRLHDELATMVLLDTPPSMADVMGRFPAARYVGQRRGAYSLPAALLDELAVFARVHDVLIIDERATAPTETGRVVGHARPEPECSTCGQPARRDRQPEHCPSCGSKWQAIEHEPYREDEHREQCARCLARQPYGFDYCQRCGSSIDHEPAPARTVVAQQIREHLDEPLPIGAVVDDVLQQQI